jgi:hypothetical protein
MLDRGRAVHAASFIRKRRIVLETELLAKPHSLQLIVLHEIFHFVWACLSNALRWEFQAILTDELDRGARGELGESSDLMKSALEESNGRAWRDYVCESFCDTAARIYGGVPRSVHWTLARRWLRRREQWFKRVFATPRAC